MSNEKKENWWRRHKMSVFVILSTVIMLIGLSYAWLQLTLRGSKELTMIAAGILYLELDESMSGGIGMENAVPVTDDVGKSQEGYTFTLENKGKIRSDYTIYLDDLELDSEKMRMSDEVIKYQLTRDEEEIGFSLLNSTGAHPSRVLESGSIAPGEKYTYVLKMWIDSSATNEVMGTVFKGQLRIEAMQENDNKLYRMIEKRAVADDVKSEFVSSSTGIDFNIAPSNTNGKGVYTLAETKTKKYPVHYYRGAVEDNNVKFAGFCWKIVRTTETGGVKMIYNGTPDSAGRCMDKKDETTLIGKSNFNNNDTSAADIGYMFGKRYESNTKNIESLSENWKYGNDVEWNGNQYILKDTIESNTKNWNNDYKQIAKKYHYTCFNNTGACTEVGYINIFRSGNSIYYLTLQGGKKLEDMKREMFANETDSTIKQVVDEWYQKNMIPYTEKLEDTVWCNDRSIDRGPLKSKDEDSSIIEDNLINGTRQTAMTYFGPQARNWLKSEPPTLVCKNKEDQFTVSSDNGNGKLTYPVALLTADEETLAGNNAWDESNATYLYTTQNYWNLSPSFYNQAHAYNFCSIALTYSSYVKGEYGVRPAISLSSHSIVASGDGTGEKPFIIA